MFPGGLPTAICMYYKNMHNNNAINHSMDVWLFVVIESSFFWNTTQLNLIDTSARQNKASAIYFTPWDDLLSGHAHVGAGLDREGQGGEPSSRHAVLRFGARIQLRPAEVQGEEDGFGNRIRPRQQPQGAAALQVPSVHPAKPIMKGRADAKACCA